MEFEKIKMEIKKVELEIMRMEDLNYFEAVISHTHLGNLKPRPREG